MKIRTQLIISMVFFVIVLIIISASVIITNQQVEQLNKQQEIVKNVELKAGDLSYLSNDYLLYRESQQIDRWNSKYSSFSSDISNLRTNNPDQQVIINNIKVNQQRLKETFEGIVSSSSSGQLNALSPEFAQVSSSRLGVQTQGIVFDASRLSQELHDEEGQLNQLNILLISALLGTVVAFLLTSYFLIYRRTLTAMSNLQAGTRIIGSGNLDHTIEDEKDDEFGELSQAFNRMTARLKTITASKTDLEIEITEREKAEDQIKNLLEETQQLNEELEVSNEELQDTTEELQVANEELQVTTEELQVSNEKLMHARDNLEQKVGERTVELKLANAYNRSLIETSLDPLVTIGPDGKINDINSATESITGYSRDDLIGTDFSDYFSDPGKAKSGYKQVFEEGFVRDYPLEIKHKNGSITSVNYNASVYKDESGEVIGVFAAARDITEINKAYNNLKETIKELERSNKELQSFAYITSHDLQEPLRSIASYAQLIQRRYGGQLDSDADEFLDFMVAGATRMKDQIQGLLDYSRVGTQGEEFKEFNAGDAINTALINLKSSIEEYDAEVNPDPLPNIVADESQIIRVFQNLIGNALKFHKERVQPKIHISARKTDDGYVFSVSDNGIGIEPQYTDRIFEVFKRLHPIGEYQGTGIGLAIVKRIIERHGGRVWVESSFGVGSTFYFTIPIIETA